jgi:hypothetical protein
MSTPECNTCHFVTSRGRGKNGQGEDVDVGFCVRFPPMVVPGGQSFNPVVGLLKTWCGEWKPAEKSVSVPPKPVAIAAKTKRK